MKRAFIREDMPSSGCSEHEHKFDVDLEKHGPGNTVLAVCKRCGESRWVKPPQPMTESGKSGRLLLG